MTRAVVAWIVGLAIAAGAGRARADTSADTPGADAEAGARLVVGLLDVRVSGMSDAVGDDFERRLEAKSAEAATGKFWFGTRARLKEMLANSTQWIDGCLLGPCMKVLREQTRVAVVVTVFLQSLGTTYRYVITLIRTDTGAVIDQRTEACGACTQDEALTAATAATVDALGTVPQKVAEVAFADPKAVELRVERSFARRHRHQRRRLVVAATVITALAVVSGGLGAYWMSQEEGDRGRPALGAAAGLGTAGLVGLALAWSWD